VPGAQDKLASATATGHPLNSAVTYGLIAAAGVGAGGVLWWRRRG